MKMFLRILWERSELTCLRVWATRSHRLGRRRLRRAPKSSHQEKIPMNISNDHQLSNRWRKTKSQVDFRQIDTRLRLIRHTRWWTCATATWYTCLTFWNFNDRKMQSLFRWEPNKSSHGSRLVNNGQKTCNLPFLWPFLPRIETKKTQTV